MKYAKLEDGYIRYVPKQVQWKGHTVNNPSAEKLLELGYLPVQYTDMPQDAPKGQHYESGWEQAETAIVQTWYFVRNENMDKLPFTQDEVFMLFAKQQINTLFVDDQTALRMKSYYPAFNEIIGQTIEKKGFKFTYKDELFKTVQDNLTIQEHYPPDQGTESLYARIDEEHEGTEYDPIPYKGNMALVKDKYYTQYGVMYLCFRDTGIEVHQTLAELVDVYVSSVK